MRPLHSTGPAGVSPRGSSVRRSRVSGSGQRNAVRPAWPSPMGAGLLLEKEVIQPQVPLRLPCYDFIPVTGTCLDALRRLR